MIVSSDIYGTILTRSGTRSPALTWDRMIPEVVHSNQTWESLGSGAVGGAIHTANPPVDGRTEDRFFASPRSAQGGTGSPEMQRSCFCFTSGWVLWIRIHQFWRIEETSAMQAIKMMFWFIDVYWFQNLNPPIRPVSRSSDLSDGLVTSGLLA